MKDFFISLSTWISAGATGLSLWFIIRFVSKHDEFKTDVKKDIEKTTESFKTAVKTMEAIVDDIKKESTSLKQMNYDFQTKLVNELYAIKKETTEITAALKVTSQKADDISLKFQSVQVHVEHLQTMVEAHHKSLSLGAQAFRTQRDAQDATRVKLDQHLEDFRTVKKVISDTLMLIKKKPE